jgi:hypothetical protein
MEAIRSSETSVEERSTQRHIPEDDILPNNNLIYKICFTYKKFHALSHVAKEHAPKLSVWPLEIFAS